MGAVSTRSGRTVRKTVWVLKGWGNWAAAIQSTALNRSSLLKRDKSVRSLGQDRSEQYQPEIKRAPKATQISA